MLFLCQNGDFSFLCLHIPQLWGKNSRIEVPGSSRAVTVFLPQSPGAVLCEEAFIRRNVAEIPHKQ